MKPDPSRRLSPHFTLRELTHSDVAERHGIDNTTEDSDIIERLSIVCCRILEPVRDNFSIRFSPSSGYRCEELNQLLRRSKTSQHILGQAVDFELPGVSNFDLANWISFNLIYDQLILENYTPGVPNSGWVHCSVINGKNRMQCLTINGGNVRQGLIK